MNLRDWIAHCATAMTEAQLAFGHGTLNARDEAWWLVAAGMGLDPAQPASALDCEVSIEDRARIERLLARRIETRKPLAYLLESAWFCGLEFFVDERVIVPRSPIAEMIQDEFAPWLRHGGCPAILDLCTGSGCIAIACAMRLAGSRVDAVDVSAPALDVAAVNIERHGLQGRVTTVESDVYQALTGRRYDLIVTNPPYVDAAVFETLPSEYHSEPGIALISKGKGLEIPLRILEGAQRHLEPDGILVCEVGESAERLEEALPRVPFTWVEFSSGGEGVFVLHRDQLVSHRQEFRDAIRKVNDVV